MIDRAFHSMALFTFHLNIWAFHLQPIRFHEASTRLMVIMRLFHFSSRRSINRLENFKRVASINGEHSYIFFYCNLGYCRSQSHLKVRSHTSSQVLLPQSVKTQFTVFTLRSSHQTVNATGLNTCFHTLRVSEHFHKLSFDTV